MVSKQIQTKKKSLTGFYIFFIMKNKNVLTLSRKDNLACDSNKSNETLSVKLCWIWNKYWLCTRTRTNVSRSLHYAIPLA